jgi:hypothetical protein
LPYDSGAVHQSLGDNPISGVDYQWSDLCLRCGVDRVVNW